MFFTPVPSPAEARMDRAYAMIRDTHRGGTNWTMNTPTSALAAGIGELTQTRMRFTLRTLEAAEVPPSGSWRADHRRAKKLAAAAAGIPDEPASGTVGT